MSSDRPDRPVPAGSDEHDVPLPAEAAAWPLEQWGQVVQRDQLIDWANRLDEVRLMARNQSLQCGTLPAGQCLHQIERLIAAMLIEIAAIGVPVPSEPAQDTTDPSRGLDGRGQEASS